MPTLPQLSLTSVDADTGVKQLDVVEDAMQSIFRSGIVPVPRPEREMDPHLPPLTHMNDAQLTTAMEDYQHWAGFLTYELAIVESQLETSKAQYEFIQSSVRIALKASEGRMTVQDKTDVMRMDTKVSQAHSKYLFNYTKYNILKALRDRAQAGWDTISRRITQRQYELEKARRGENVASIPAQFGSAFRRR